MNYAAWALVVTHSAGALGQQQEVRLVGPHWQRRQSAQPTETEPKSKPDADKVRDSLEQRQPGTGTERVRTARRCDCCWRMLSGRSISATD